MSLTYAEKLSSTAESWQVRFERQPDDGLVVLSAKTVLRPVATLWNNCFFRALIPQFEQTSRIIIVNSLGGNSEQQFRFAIDLYKACMTSVMLLAYMAVAGILVVEQKGCLATLLVVICCAFAAGRIVELFTLLLILYSDKQYRPKSYFRAVCNSFWHYLELAAGFGIFNAAVALCDPTAFSKTNGGEQIGDTLLGPFYYSFVSVSTIGFGDITPVATLPRLFLIVQVALGLFLILIVLPSCISQFASPVESPAVKNFALPIGILSEQAPWLQSQAFEEETKFLKLTASGCGVGAVLFLEAANQKCFAVVRKAFREGYEFSGQYSLPGGMIRRNSSEDLVEGIKVSLCDRLKKETGLFVATSRVAPLPVLPPPVTSYTVKGEEQFTVVLPFYAYWEGEVLEIQSHSSSVDEAVWTAIPPEWENLTPATCVILGSALWLRLSAEQRRTALPHIAAATTRCNSWASRVGLPVSRPWFL